MRSLVIFLLLACLTVALCFAGANNVFAQDFLLESEAALLMDVDSGTVVFEKDMSKQLYPASITKIMTALLALEGIETGKVNLTDRVTISESAANMGGSQIFLSAGDEVSLEDLIISMLVASANDAAYAVAEHLDGSMSVFVERMNERARELGMNNTSFKNSHGLHDEEHYTTAFEVSIVARELLRFPQVHEWSSIWMNENFLQGQIRAGEVFLSNTNRMIRYYKGCDGLKTGFTSEAGSSIVATAKREGTRFLAVVLAAPSSKVRYNEAKALLDYGFANYRSFPVVEKGELIQVVDVEKGRNSAVNLVAAEKLSLLLDKGADAQVEKEFALPSKIAAPIEEGQEFGKLIVKQQGKNIGEVSLVAEKEVQRAGLRCLFLRLVSAWLRFGR